MRVWNRWRGLLGDALLVVVLIAVLEYRGADFLPQVNTYAALTQGLTVYPATYSDYLPFTTPSGVEILGSFGRIAFNDLGYRGPDPRRLDKPPDTVRVLFLGDSFTLGWGVAEADSFPGLVRSHLASWQPAVEVINAAYHAGYSPDAYYAYIRREGIALDPDVVVVVLYLGNDLTDMMDNVWGPADEYGAPQRIRTFRHYSNYLGELLDPGLLPWNFHIPILRDSRYFIALTNFVNTRLLGFENRTTSRAGQEPTEESWECLVLVTRALANFCEAQDIALVYALLPLPGTPRDGVPYAAEFEALLHDDLGLPYISMYDSLTRAHQIPGDGHLTVEGNILVADALLALIEPRLPSPP